MGFCTARNIGYREEAWKMKRSFMARMILIISIILTGLILVNNAFADECRIDRDPRSHPQLMEAIRKFEKEVLASTSTKIEAALTTDCDFLVTFYPSRIKLVVDKDGKIIQKWGNFDITHGTPEQMFSLYSAGMIKEADKALETMVKRSFPDHLVFYYYAAESYIRLGKIDEAIAILNKAVDYSIIIGVGIRIQIVDDYPVVKDVIKSGAAERESIQPGDKIIKVDGKSTNGWDDKKFVETVRGSEEGTQVVFLIERSGEKIEKNLTRKKVFTSKSAAYLGMRSIVYREKGDMERAMQDAQKAYSIDASVVPARLALGVIYIDQGRYEEAGRLIAPVKDSWLILAAEAYARQKRYQEALEIYNAIPEPRGKYIIFENNRKNFLQIFKDYALSRKATAQSLEDRGHYKEALNEYAELLKIPGARDAKEIWEGIGRIIKKDPRYAAISEGARRYLVRAEVLVRDGKFEDAVKEYRTAIKLSPFTPEIYFNSALVYGETKDYAEAIRHMNIYLQLSPDASNARQAQDKIYEWEMMMEKEGK